MLRSLGVFGNGEGKHDASSPWWEEGGSWGQGGSLLWDAAKGKREGSPVPNPWWELEKSEAKAEKGWEAM